MTRFHVDPDEPADVHEDGDTGNVIVIRARMNIDIFGRLKAEIKARNAGDIDVAPMLLHNILGWRGPDFDGLPCTPENILALPPAELDPFIAKVVNEIAERNRRHESPNERSPAIDSTSVSAGEPGLTESLITAPRPTNHLSASGTSALTSRIVSAGRLSKSAD